METPTNAEIRDLVELACHAPSVHNTQPWRWVYQDGVLALHADGRRQLMYADDARRDLVISCGAALHQLEVAAGAAGWATSITRLPDPLNEMHLASVTFEQQLRDPDEAIVSTAITARGTDRRQVASWPVPAARIEALAAAAARLGVLTTPLDEGMQQKVFDLISRANRAQHANEPYLDELLAWTHAGEAGVPATSVPTNADSARTAGAITRFPSGSLQDDHADDAAPAPSWLLLSTSSDDILSRLRTGEALASIWLTCTLAGLALVPYTQPVEVEGTRAALQADLLDGNSCPQILLRIGWPASTSEPVPPTPRRPVDQVLELPDASP